MKNIKFNKAFPVSAVISCVLIVAGAVGYFVRGINFGIDFVPGLIEEVRVSPVSIELTYDGAASVALETNSSELSLVISGTGAENETKVFSYYEYPTMQKMAEAIDSVAGVHAVLRSSGNESTYGIYTDSSATLKLSSDSPVKVFVPSPELSVSVDQIRDALAGQSVVVKELGQGSERSFQIRAAITAEDESSEQLQTVILGSLDKAFGRDNLAIVKTDFVGSSFSNSIAIKSIVLALVTLVLIWLYATIRFHWDFALGAIIALIHDCLIMFAFISWTQIELSSTSFAAVLTIFGYSINATVVILDRVRENIKISDTKDFNEILNKSISGTLSRSIITTVTTLFASLSLMIFTHGSIRDFAIILTCGLISGCYSSMLITPGFISLVRNKKKAE